MTTQYSHKVIRFIIHLETALNEHFEYISSFNFTFTKNIYYRSEMNRAILSLRHHVPLMRRAMHKGFESTPPMRFTSMTENVVLYLLIAGTFLSYPSYVLANLDNIRPKPQTALNPKVQAQIEEIRASRKKN
ncbi:hypothetical protein DICVIV_12087 [Dictyocaulus viviparus]|uniref:Uncharacterized protein n=1 Tax=Dictyocaulus viviparus TaxID=29172 RepID=A0A0D8XDU2_DICVI|nr:hypothetical protein DICVIV_12087 [Dictyocaulus viviparus]